MIVRDFMAAYVNCTCYLASKVPDGKSIRFPAVYIVNVNADCSQHGHLHIDNADPRLSLAANLRYGD